MEQFLGFALPGVPYGCTYALVAVCLVLTYQATGVFNFAFGAQAFASAFVFTYLTQYHDWSGFEAFVVSVVVLGPAMGWAFDRLLFRHIPNSNSTAKMVCSLALLVGIPSLLPVIFGPQNLDATATILPFFNPNVVYFTIAGTPINGIYLATISVTVVVLVLLTILLRFTNLGLQMRAAVESRRLVQLDGVNANGVVAIAWIVSSFMASLAGVLLAPIFGAFSSDDYVTLTVTAIAAAAWALLRSMPIAAGVAVLIGVLTTTLQGYIPPNSLFNAAIVPALPFLFLVAALLFLPGMRSLDASRDPLATIDPPPPPIAATTPGPEHGPDHPGPVVDPLRRLLRVHADVDAGRLGHRLQQRLDLLDRAALHHVDHGDGRPALPVPGHAWPGWARSPRPSSPTTSGLNLLVGGLVGAALAAAVAVVLALLSLRLKGLGLALMTLAAALLFDATFFNETSITGGPEGVSIQAKWLGTHALLQFRRSRHVPPVARRPHRRRDRRPAGPQGDGRPEPGGHAGQRDGDGGPGCEPLVAAHHGLRPVRGHRRRRRLAPQPRAAGRLARRTGTRTSRSCSSCWW